jgi:hypothetical protein
MEELNEQGADLKPASELPRQLPDPRTEAEPPPAELIPTAPDTARPRPSHNLNNHEPKGAHSAAVLARRPNFAPVPNGYRNVLVHVATGIKVNRGVEKPNLGTAAIQFAEDRPLSRATEYDLMEMIQNAGFQYKAANRQWERPLQEGMELGDNAIDAVRLAKEIADARSVERGR